MANFGLGDSVDASNLVSRSFPDCFKIWHSHMNQHSRPQVYSVFNDLKLFYLNDPPKGMLASVEKGIKGGVWRRMSRERKERREERWAA